jgi:hypothetical protein
MARVLLVAGTAGLFGWDLLGHSRWYTRGSPFVRALEAVGHELAAPDDPYSWTQDIDGLVAGHRAWEEAGNALRWWWRARGGADAVIAHSHALQVLAYARIPAPVLVTVGSPVRVDLMGRYTQLAGVVWSWHHLYSDRDVWQLLGEFGDGAGWLAYRRTIPWAENVLVPGASHSGLLEPMLWTDAGWWTWLTPIASRS